MYQLKKIFDLFGNDDQNSVKTGQQKRVGKAPIVLVENNFQKPIGSFENDTHSKRIMSHFDLPKFSDALAKNIGVAPELLHTIYPILVDEQKKLYALILEEKELKSELFVTIKTLLADSGYHQADIWLYIAPYSVVLYVSRNGATVIKAVAAAQSRSTSPYFTLFSNLAQFGLKNKASDIHLEINLEAEFSDARFCIDGKMIRVSEYKIASTELLLCVSHMYNNYGVDVSEAVFNQNIAQQCNIPLRVQNTELEFRFASLPTSDGILIVMRLTIAHQAHITKKEYAPLGYLPDQIQLIEFAVSRPKGGIVICGRVGSGKTTLQHTILTNIPEEKSIITIEDPVENKLPNASQVSISRALTDETKDYDAFQASKRQIKRLNPKVVAAGEVRDDKTAELWKDAVEAGLLGLCTIHCGSVVEALTMRLVSKQLGIGREVISTPDFINLIIFQALIRTLCDHCKIPASEVYDDEYLSKIENHFQGLNRKTMYAANIEGCPHCRRPFSSIFNGFSSRIAVAEMLRPDYEMLRLVRDAKNIEIAKRFSKMREKTTYADPDTKGKTAMEVAMYHVHCGVFDPKEVEVELGTFDDYYLTKLEQIDV